MPGDLFLFLSLPSPPIKLSDFSDLTVAFIVITCISLNVFSRNFVIQCFRLCVAGKGGGDKISNKENIKMEVSIKEKVQQLMDLTHLPEDQVCWALHESDNDMNTAMNLLYEENAPHVSFPFLGPLVNWHGGSIKVKNCYSKLLNIGINKTLNLSNFNTVCFGNAVLEEKIYDVIGA